MGIGSRNGEEQKLNLWKLMSQYFRKHLILVAVCAALAALAAGSLLVSIATRKEAGRHTLPDLANLSDADVAPAKWGQGFPLQYASFESMAHNSESTPFGGSVPYSRIIRYPQLTRLWAGYPFGMDFNEERSHVFSQVDQVETKRNDTAWLNTHGFPDFKGQPGACMNCHSGWTPSLIREMGWENFNSTPYATIREKLVEKHGEGLHAANLGSTCADCHSPKDMSLRVTRPAYINAMVARGYQANAEKGIEAGPQEMRSHVCQQCHVEYYFKGPKKELTFPWTQWPKDKSLRIEMVEKHYQAQREAGGFEKDWVHKETGAPMLKAQHPETELSSSGVHARSGVSCVDCHMPFVREGARKITQHNLRSPLLQVRESCGTCHAGSDESLRDRILLIQTVTAGQLRNAEGAVLALADDIVKANALLESAGKGADAANLLSPAREAHRLASFRWDFIASENSTGFHSPQESSRVLGLAAESARQGQLALAAALSGAGIPFSPTLAAGAIPKPGAVISEHKAPVGSLPDASHSRCDTNLEAGCRLE